MVISSQDVLGKPLDGWWLRLYTIIFEADTRAGRLFDQSLGRALAASRRKILVFLAAVLMIVLVMGTLMYVVEGPANGYTSIPTSVYWAITTMTTVGFGDITPKTDLGRLISSAMMLLGWGTLAVPTGIVTAEMTAGTPSRRLALRIKDLPEPCLFFRRSMCFKHLLLE